MTSKEKLTTLIVTVQNRPGVLYKISGLIRKRQFNIESLTVSHTEQAGISRFTILVRGDEDIIEKMSKQLYRMIEVLKVSDPKENQIVARELALFKISTVRKESRKEIAEIAKHFRTKAVNVNPKYVVYEVTGNEEKVDAFYENMKRYGIIEFVRTGRTALFK